MQLFFLFRLLDEPQSVQLLLRSCIGVRALPSHRQILKVSHPTVRPDIDEALDIVTFHALQIIAHYVPLIDVVVQLTQMMRA